MRPGNCLWPSEHRLHTLPGKVGGLLHLFSACLLTNPKGIRFLPHEHAHGRRLAASSPSPFSIFPNPEPDCFLINQHADERGNTALPRPRNRLRPSESFLVYVAVEFVSEHAARRSAALR